VSRYQKGKPNLDFTEAKDSEWQWHPLGRMQFCISLQTDNHASTPPLQVFLQAGCPSCRPTNSVKALKAVSGLTFSSMTYNCHRITYKLVLPTNCVSLPGKHFIPLSLSTCLNSFVAIFHPDPCVLPIQISLPDQPVLLATFPLRPFLCLHLLLGTLYLHTFVLLTPYPPLNAT